MKKNGRKLFLLLFAGALFCLISGIRAGAEPKAYEMLVPEADVRLYTQEELAGMTPQIAAYARNEIYARHGRKFRSAELNAWFGEQPWYVGSIEPDDFSDSSLNRFESQNVDLLKAQEIAASADGSGYKLNQPGYDFAAVYQYLYDDFDILSGLEVFSTSEMVMMDADHFTLTAPAGLDWTHQQLGKDAFEIVYKPAQRAGLGGWVVTIAAFAPEDKEYEEYPNYRICGEGQEKTYVAILPTDVQFDYKDSTQSEEYGTLIDWAETLDIHHTGNPFTVVEMEDGGDPDKEESDRAE